MQPSIASNCDAASGLLRFLVNRPTMPGIASQQALEEPRSDTGQSHSVAFVYGSASITYASRTEAGLNVFPDSPLDGVRALSASSRRGQSMTMVRKTMKRKL